MSKLARLEKPPIVKGSRISNPDGTKYIVVRVSGSTVTADRIPTTLELVARSLGIVAGVCRSAYRNARASVRDAAKRSKAKHRPEL